MSCVFVHKLPASATPWAYAIEFDFNQDMVDAIKDKIPSRQRKWVPSAKMWMFKAEAIDQVCILAIIHVGRYVHVEPSEEESSHAPAVPAELVAAYRELHLLPSAPPPVVTAAYKALAKLAHPDKGGTTRQMQRVNEAYGRLTHR